MAKTMEEIRKKLLAQEEKKNPNNFQKNSGGDKTVYKFWDIPFDDSSTIRFLPDGDSNNDFFWVERLVIKLPFRGVIGKTDKTVEVTVPCLEMFGKRDPIIDEIRPWWKDDSLVDMARKYYKKKSYLFQGFVVRSSLEEEGVDRYDLRRFVINSSIFDIIKQSLLDPDMDLPTDYNTGRDFKISKTKKGDHANYSTSGWTMKPRALDNSELAVINDKGLWTLKDFLPKEPSEAEVEIIKQMFEASVNEEAYDPAKWGNYYRPAGVDLGDRGGNSSHADDDDVVSAPAAKAVESAPATSSEERVDAMARLRERASSMQSSAPAEETKPAASSGGSASREDIMRVIRERAAKSAQ